MSVRRSLFKFLDFFLSKICRCFIFFFRRFLCFCFNSNYVDKIENFIIIKTMIIFVFFVHFIVIKTMIIFVFFVNFVDETKSITLLFVNKIETTMIKRIILFNVKKRREFFRRFTFSVILNAQHEFFYGFFYVELYNLYNINFSRIISFNSRFNSWN